MAHGRLSGSEVLNMLGVTQFLPAGFVAQDIELAFTIKQNPVTGKRGGLAKACASDTERLDWMRDSSADPKTGKMRKPLLGTRDMGCTVIGWIQEATVLPGSPVAPVSTVQ